MINPEAVVGVDIGGTKIASAVVHEAGIDTSTVLRYKTPSDPNALLAVLGNNLVRMADENNVDTVVMGVPGPVQWEGEQAISAGPFANIKAFPDTEPFDLVGRLAEEVPETQRLDVHLFNDAHIAAQAAVRLLTPDDYINDRPHVTTLVSTGVGGDVIVDYRPLTRNRNIRLEIGHAGVGYPAVSIENLVSGTAIKERFGMTPEELADDRSALAEKIWQEVGETLAVGTGNLLALLDPDHIAFAGGVSAGCAERFLPYYRARMHDIARAGSAISVTVPELTAVTPAEDKQLALRGTIWAHRGLQPIPSL